MKKTVIPISKYHPRNTKVKTQSNFIADFTKNNLIFINEEKIYKFKLKEKMNPDLLTEATPGNFTRETSLPREQPSLRMTGNTPSQKGTAIGGYKNKKTKNIKILKLKKYKNIKTKNIKILKLKNIKILKLKNKI